MKVSRLLSLANFNKEDQKSILCAIFDEKSLNFEKFIKNFCHKKHQSTNSATLFYL